MIEIKMSQGAKPGHGGLLPGSFYPNNQHDFLYVRDETHHLIMKRYFRGSCHVMMMFYFVHNFFLFIFILLLFAWFFSLGPKVTTYIAEARGVEPGVDCHSPPRHSAFADAVELVQFIQTLRELSGGKPIGFKLCVGRPEEFTSIIAACLEANSFPDFITVDGAEGGTGAAPPEFSNSVGMPLVEGLAFVDGILIGAGIRDQIKVIASGKVLTGFSIVRNLALGADVCNSARAMLFALGCIQALKCDTNKCPTGITTQDPELAKGLDVGTKSVRVASYHRKTVEAALDIMGAIGLSSPQACERHHVTKRVSIAKAETLAVLYPLPPRGSLLNSTAPKHIQGRDTRHLEI